MSYLPSRARVVVVGGGVGGTSVAYHLAALGERDMPARRARRSDRRLHVRLRRPRGPAARRPHADADEQVQRGAVPAAAGGRAPAGLGRERQPQVASSPERLEEIRRQVSWARAAGLPLEEVGPDEVARLFPPADTRGRPRGLLPAVGRTGRPVAAHLRLWRRGRAPGGVRIATRTRVLADRDRARRPPRRAAPGHPGAHRPRGRRVRGRRRLRRACTRRRWRAWSASGCRSCRCRTSTW